MNSAQLSTERKGRSTAIDIDVEGLITEIYHRPSIWNPNHTQYRNINVLKRMWKEIQKARFPEYGIEVLKKKWKCLKDGFRKELKKNQILQAENPNVEDYELSQWKYFKSLTFLQDVFATDEDPDESTKSPTQPQEEDSKYFEAKVLKTQSDARKSSQKRCLHNDIRAEYLEIERKKLKILEQEVAKQNNTDTEKSDDYYYLMSILPEMQKLTPIQKMRVRNKINQVLMDEMMPNEYEEQDPVHAQNAYSPQNSFIKEETELI